MSRIKLNKTNIDALQPAEKRFTVWDTDLRGFGVTVAPSGERSYVLFYRISGRQRWLTIGRHGSPWTPEMARKEAMRLLVEVARGVDPAAKRNSDRQAVSFAELCDLYLGEGVAHKKASTLRNDRSRIKLHLKPLLGTKRADAIGRADIERLLNDVKNRRTAAPRGPTQKRPPGSIATGGAGAAAQCVALASTVLQFGVDRGLRTDNPAKGIKKPPVRKLQRFLSEDEMRRLAEALDAEEREISNRFVVAAIRLLALTGCRRSEITGLRWRNVDFERRLLLLDDSKTREKAVFLSPPAVSILASLPRSDGKDFVIAGSRVARASSVVDKAWDRVRKRAGLGDVRMHDLRHTFASFGAAASLGLPVIGKLLGHTQAQTTARYSHLAADPLRRAADTIGATIAAAMRMDADDADNPTTADWTLVTEVSKFLGVLLGLRPEQLHAQVQAEVFRLTTTREALAPLRERRSAGTRKALGDLREALQRLKGALNRLPEDFRLLFRADDVIRRLKSYEEFLNKKAVGIEETADGNLRVKFQPRLQKRNAEDKRLAVEYALRLFEIFGLLPTTTQGGQFEKLAAILHDDKNAGSFHEQIKEVLRERREEIKKNGL
jgi:integrase